MIRKVLAAVAASTLLASAGNAAIVYDTNVTVGADGAFTSSTAHAMQNVTLNLVTNQVNITNMIFGVRYNATGAGVLILRFWTGIDQSVGATNALTGATLAATVGFNLPSQAVGSYNYNLPMNLNVPSTTFAVECLLLNTAQTAFSSNMGIRITTGAPSIGSNDGFLYRDFNTDNIFTGAERSQVNGLVSLQPVGTHMRMNIDAVPTPASAALIGLGGLIAARRRRA